MPEIGAGRARAFAPDSPHVTRVVPSPNFGERRGGRRPDMLLLHYTGMPAGRGMTAGERAIRWLADPASQVSAHYVVDEDGTIVQMVPEAGRAWHAGVGGWGADDDINSCSIGIEIANPGYPWNLSAIPDRSPGEPVEVHPGLQPYPQVQVEAVIRLSADIVARHAIAANRVLAHSDIAPARKADPGELFPWNQLAAAGVGAWVPPSPVSEQAGVKGGGPEETVGGLQKRLKRLGYVINLTGCLDEQTRLVVTAFQRHWRPERVDGEADDSTSRTLDRLLSVWEG